MITLITLCYLQTDNYVMVYFCVRQPLADDHDNSKLWDLRLRVLLYMYTSNDFLEG